MKVKEATCNVCGKFNKECVQFPVIWFIHYDVCQSCISKAFRGFSKAK